LGGLLVLAIIVEPPLGSGDEPEVIEVGLFVLIGVYAPRRFKTA
jgi:hypothetical protein